MGCKAGNLFLKRRSSDRASMRESLQYGPDDIFKRKQVGTECTEDLYDTCTLVLRDSISFQSEPANVCNVRCEAPTRYWAQLQQVPGMKQRYHPATFARPLLIS